MLMWDYKVILFLAALSLLLFMQRKKRRTKRFLLNVDKATHLFKNILQSSVSPSFGEEWTWTLLVQMMMRIQREELGQKREKESFET